MRGGAEAWNQTYRRNGANTRQGETVLSYTVDDGKPDEEVSLEFLGRCPDVFWRHAGGRPQAVDLGRGATARFAGRKETFAGDDIPLVVHDPRSGEALLVGGGVARLRRHCDRHGSLGLVPVVVYGRGHGRDGLEAFEFGRGGEPELVWTDGLAGFRLRGGRYRVSNGEILSR